MRALVYAVCLDDGSAEALLQAAKKSIKRATCKIQSGAQEAQLFADNFATSSHNYSQVHSGSFLQSSTKSSVNSLSWTILQITPLF
jgi:hypothetical protein